MIDSIIKSLQKDEWIIDSNTLGDFTRLVRADKYISADDEGNVRIWGGSKICSGRGACRVNLSSRDTKLVVIAVNNKIKELVESIC